MMNRRGQVAIEGMLLIVVMVSGFLVFTRFAQENKIAAKMVSKPWEKISGMAENGVWTDPKTGQILHPGAFARVRSMEPK